ncbi:XrtA system polysaccharide deacetylase [Porticoccus sp.]|uniref:XrtA system polysaccharide deacetylase n=1 Tax=Porticoccus sp. TaxID=2024853 RepID=UPI0025E0BC11|nr:XrtA system polysaccharide deacetylase [Porticoccus sp.]
MNHATSIRNAMSVDVEDYYHVSAFEGCINKKQWNEMPCRIEANMERILALFEQKSIKATFFTLGCVAERYPAMVREIVDQGHELASHGWEHIRVTQQNQQAFTQDITRTRQLLEDLSGQPVIGYRAASYSICEENLWALDCLADAGYQYSSSIVPIRHDHYGIPGAPRFAFPAANNRLLEIPVTTIPVAGRNINCGGGGWFRLFPYSFTRWAINRVNRKEHQPCIFYFHPWEIDPEQPRVPNAGSKARFRHYLNLHKVHHRLEQLADDFLWGRVDEVFLKGFQQKQTGNDQWGLHGACDSSAV